MKIGDSNEAPQLGEAPQGVTLSRDAEIVLLTLRQLSDEGRLLTLLAVSRSTGFAEARCCLALDELYAKGMIKPGAYLKGLN
jgi:hypothetical protein